MALYKSLSTITVILSTSHRYCTGTFLSIVSHKKGQFVSRVNGELDAIEELWLDFSLIAAILSNDKLHLMAAVSQSINQYSLY